MHPHLLPLAAAALLLFLAPSLGAQEKFLLRQHWEPGKIYRFETNMDMEMTTPAAPGLAAGVGGGVAFGGPQTTTMILQTEVTIRKEPGSDRKLADVKVTSMKGMMTANGEIKTYDSTDPAMSEPEFQQAFGALANKSVTIVYDKDDNYVDVIVPADFAQTPVAGAQGPDGKQFAAMMRYSLESGLPGEPVAVGAPITSEKKLEAPPMTDMITKLKGRLESIVTHEGRKHARILMDGTMQMPHLPEGAPFIQPDAKITSETLFDLERKAVSRSTTKNETTMNLGEMKMTMKQTSTTTLKAIDPAPPEKK